MTNEGWLARHEAMTDAELRMKIDEDAQNVGVYGLSFWLDELGRRRTKTQLDELVKVSERTAEQLSQLAASTQATERLAKVSLLVATIAAIAAVVALF